MIAAFLAAQAVLWLLPLQVVGSGIGRATGSVSTNGSTGRPNHALLPELTQREIEVLYLLAEGLTNTQIGLRLRISQHTVRAHLYSIYSKLNVNGRVQAAMLVIS